MSELLVVADAEQRSRRNLSRLLDLKRRGGAGQVFVPDLAERGRGQEEHSGEGKHGGIKRGGGGGGAGRRVGGGGAGGALRRRLGGRFN